MPNGKTHTESLTETEQQIGPKSEHERLIAELNSLNDGNEVLKGIYKSATAVREENSREEDRAAADRLFDQI